MGEFIFADQYILENSQSRKFYLEFLKGLVHKTNNTIGVIQGFGSLVLMEDGLDPSVRESVEQMETAGRQMSELNKKILGAGGCSKVSPTRCVLSEMFPFFEEKISDLCKTNGVTCEFRAQPGIPDVFIDQSRFSEVIDELFRNAAEGAGEAKGGSDSVTIEVFSPGTATSAGHVDLFIRNPCRSDISSEKLKEFFEPFYSSKGNDHYGIGLTAAAVLSGDMNMRLGMKVEESEITTWLAIPIEEV